MMLPWLLTAAIGGGGIPVRWTMPADTTRPPRRAHHAMVYDAANRRVLLTGGSTPIDSGRQFGFFDDLWGFDGIGWRKLGSSGSASSGRRLAFDSDRGFVVSYGGYPAAVAGEVRVLEQDRWRTFGQHPTAGLAQAGLRLRSGPARGRTGRCRPSADSTRRRPSPRDCSVLSGRR